MLPYAPCVLASQVMKDWSKVLSKPLFGAKVLLQINRLVQMFDAFAPSTLKVECRRLYKLDVHLLLYKMLHCICISKVQPIHEEYIINGIKSSVNKIFLLFFLLCVEQMKETHWNKWNN